MAFTKNSIGYQNADDSQGDLHDGVCSAKSGNRPHRKHIRVHTFGFFDIFVDDEIVVFTSRRAKELLAFLIDHGGGMVQTGYIIEAFWPEEPECEGNKAIFRKALMNLKKTLEAYCIGHILITKRGQKAIVASELDCDCYKALKGCANALSEYYGSYMEEYSWAETTNARLSALAEKLT